MFDVAFDRVTGGVRAIRHAEDRHRMNWVEGYAVFGTLKNATVESVCETEHGMSAVYRTSHLTVHVKRELVGRVYRETYVFENPLDADVFIGRGELGIYATFNDSYENAKVCMTERCHTHLWCGKSSSYVKAVKMGPFPYGLALVLTQGMLDSYSVERDLKKISNDRGDFLLHPSPFHLLPHGKMTLQWELLWFREDEFEKTLEEYGSILGVKAESYTVFLGEPIRFSLDKPNAEVFLKGRAIEVERTDTETRVCLVPSETGDYTFDIRYGEHETRVEFFVSLPFSELVKRRAEFIVEHQQLHCDGSPLDGAYLIYDNEEGRVHFDELFTDRNASRERLMMGLFLAKYLQFHKDERIYDSLMKYYRFVSREFYDEESGAVYNAIRRNPKFKRLYNAPWMSVFTMEMYKLTGDGRYLDNMYKLLCVYYSIGGEEFYPNGLSIYESVEVLRSAGREEMAEKLLQFYKRHIDRIVETGVYYPEHEVNYEQAIVTPAVTLTAQLCLLTKNKELLAPCREQLRILEKFNGHQPSHHLYEMSIRHWDGYWFGKRQNYGDTFPHPASIHTANAYLHYAMISGDENYRKKAYRGARNLLSLFRPDGSASNCYVYPFSVNGVRCEYYDEYANDQDGALYYLMKFYHFEKGSSPLSAAAEKVQDRNS